jgi:hypothetical protein
MEGDLLGAVSRISTIYSGKEQLRKKQPPGSGINDLY